ncbi:pyruvate carboxylase [Listeria marthii FSL S4-120]|uniref:Pyruvate carboxylase n=1 Tax=Listeria marthii FSL S4-120 TaxID=702457 RepID=A0ABN0BTK0_9LIST|nr:pyruvate carboxylase [Listeria marthii FSL S4-120]
MKYTIDYYKDMAKELVAQGTHILHTSKEHPSYIQLPIINK